METWIILLAIVGLLLVSLEVFLPGGVLGVIGVVAIIAASILIGMQYGFGYAVLSMVVLTCAGFALIMIELKILGRGPWRKSFLLDSAVKGNSHQPDEFPEADVGQEAVTVTALSPTGVVELHGNRREAFSQSGFLDKGVRVEVTGRDNFRLLVRRK